MAGDRRPHGKLPLGRVEVEVSVQREGDTAGPAERDSRIVRRLRRGRSGVVPVRKCALNEESSSFLARPPAPGPWSPCYAEP